MYFTMRHNYEQRKALNGAKPMALNDFESLPFVTQVIENNELFSLMHITNLRDCCLKAKNSCCA